MTPSFNKDLSKIMASIVPTDASAYGESTIQVGSDKKVQPKKSSFSSVGSLPSFTSSCVPLYLPEAIAKAVLDLGRMSRVRCFGPRSSAARSV